MAETAKNLFRKLSAGRPVQPPSAPPPKEFQPNPFQVVVPYSLEEFPRTFLHLLSVSTQVPVQVRTMINAFLEEYDKRVVEWVTDNYGEGALAICEEITKQVMQAQQIRAQQEAQIAESEILPDLEKQFSQDDDE